MYRVNLHDPMHSEVCDSESASECVGSCMVGRVLDVRSFHTTVEHLDTTYQSSASHVINLGSQVTQRIYTGPTEGDVRLLGQEPLKIPPQASRRVAFSAFSIVRVLHLIGGAQFRLNGLVEPE
jgi:hypothetical protein